MTRGPAGSRGRAAGRFAVLLGAAWLAAGCVTAQKAEKARGSRDLGYAYLQEGNLGGAVEELRKSIALNPRDPEAHHRLALAYFARRFYDEAEGSFRAATRLREDFPEAWLNWGSMKLAQERWAEAIPLLEKAALDPTYREPGRAWHNIGHARTEMGDLAGAREAFERVLKVTALFCPSVVGLGRVHEKQGDLREAVRLYRRARQCDEGDLHAVLRLGVALARMGEWGEALPLLNLVADRAPESGAGAEARDFLERAP